MLESNSQTGDSSKRHNLKRRFFHNDSVGLRLEKLKDSALQIYQQLDTSEISKNINRNVGDILQLQKEQKAKQKKAAVIRIVIGIVMLVVLIIGLRRKTVKK